LRENSFFCPAVVAKNYLNTSPGSTLEVLHHFSLCADFGNKTLLPINDTLAKSLDAKYLILFQAPFSRPLGHSDGRCDKAAFIFSKRTSQKSQQDMSLTPPKLQ
jgi:hypothetical protein